eukprot:730668-Ditylum_brightwellii.AAC.1
MLHPKKKVAEKYPNMGPQDRLDDLLVFSRGKKAIKSREQNIIFVHHDDSPNDMLYTSERFAKVTKKGPESEFFTSNISVPPPSQEESKDEENEEVERREKDIQNLHSDHGEIIRQI